MCGIWLLFKDNKIKINVQDKELLQNFFNIQRRGPDNTIFLQYPHCIIGFHRLSIMDTTNSSNQPYVYNKKDKTVIFMCNGEIYNYKSLETKYNLNVNRSDCKVISELYLQSKDDKSFAELFKKDIKGEFAFVIIELDKYQNVTKIVAGRDMIGIRPLYHDKHNFFTSELKGGIQYSGKLFEFPPGNIMSYSISPLEEINRKLYNFEWIYDIKPILKDETCYLGKIRNAVINSVKRRLDSDRDIAFLVSGGVDSSLVAGIASKILKTPIKTFCCGMDGSTDIKHSRQVAEHIGSKHHEVMFTKDDGFNSITEVVYATETWDTTTIRASVGQFIVSKYISQNTNCKVVLVGEGPDEVCSSYLFNYYAPDGKSLHDCAIEYVKKLHNFDIKRVDRCVAHWGLEARVPLLDPEVIRAYWEIPAEWRHPKHKGFEKWWLRMAFEGYDVLPKNILWRKKEAFSDGVSSTKESWYSTIQKRVESIDIPVDAKEPSKEAYYFKQIFIEQFGKNLEHVVPHYWLPKWNEKGEEIKEYMDPSARVLNIYKKK